MKKEEYLAFAIDDRFTRNSFVQVGNQFFIHEGTLVVISPVNRLVSLELDSKKNIATFYLGYGTNREPHLKVDLNQDPKKVVKKYVDNYLAESKKSRFLHFLKNIYTIELFPTFAPTIAMIDTRELIEPYKKGEDGIVIETIISDDTPIKLVKNEEYTKIKGIKIPIKRYEVVSKTKTSEKVEKFSDVVKKCANSIKRM